MSFELFLVPCRNTITNTESRSDHAESWGYKSIPSVQFSDCGSFCFLAYQTEVLVLKSSLLEEKAAKTLTPAVWGYETSYNRRAYLLNWRWESTMVRLYQAVDYVDIIGPGGSRTYQISLSITVVPAHLASGTFYLLVGKSGDDLTRVLFLPEKGSPEIKYLSVTLNQILDELATKSAKANESFIEEDASDIKSEEA